MVIYLILVSKIIKNDSYSVNCIFLAVFLHVFGEKNSDFNAILFIQKNVQNFQKCPKILGTTIRPIRLHQIH